MKQEKCVFTKREREKTREGSPVTHSGPQLPDHRPPRLRQRTHHH